MWTDEYREEWKQKYPGRLKVVRHNAHVKYLAKLRLEAFNHYGGPICACCGETIIQFLTLDHVNNDGAEERRRLNGTNKRAGWGFYVYLRQQGYPPLPLQVLCLNCNIGRHKNGGVCPHELTRQTSPNGGTQSLSPLMITQSTG